jgi:predicted dehydrogenase
MSNNKIKLGMIGGGQDAFIGAIHRLAANLDGQYELVGGAFSSTPEKSINSGIALGLSPERCYANYEELFEKEKALPAAQRMQVISIVTPNHLHFQPAKLALENGYAVILDKPLGISLTEAKALQAIIHQTNGLFCLTHTYTGYPMVKEAKQIIAEGKLGTIKKIYVSYPQGWLTNALEASHQKQATWRTNPTKSGPAGAMGDIGTHAFNLAEYITGLRVTKLCADINTVVPSRLLDDDGAVLLKFNNGASGVLIASQVAAGEENNIKINVYGTFGGLEWAQENSNTLLLKWLDKPAQILRCGTTYTGMYAQHNTRTPAGHPEGYIEAFANLYRNVALTLKATFSHTPPTAAMKDFPGINEGIRGMAFIEQVIASGKSDQKWTDFKL